MVRNLDHRVEATAPVFDEGIKKVLNNILNIQFSDNVKARILNNELDNEFVKSSGKKVRSQIEIYNYLLAQNNKNIVENTDVKERPPIISTVA